MSAEVIVVLALATFAAFLLSSAVGLGGSLVLVPTLVIAIGPKEGVALAALLLACNNVVKVIAYRATLPFKRAGVVLVCTIGGAAAGASLMTAVPESVVVTAVLVSLALSLLLEQFEFEKTRRASSPALAFASGATSGFSGTSGPLKGGAVKSLGLDRMHTVGAASIVSLGGDLTKTAIFGEAGLFGSRAWALAALAVPLMLAGTFLGRRLTHWLGDRRWSAVFWATMVGYSARLLLA
jgi:uncharacterized membrane protein YfcA